MQDAQPSSLLAGERSRHASEPIGHAQALWRLGLWLLPLVCLTAVAWTLVIAAESLATHVPEVPSTEGAVSIESPMHWVWIVSTMPDGSTARVTCLARTDRLKDDELYVRLADLADVAIDLCTDPSSNAYSN